MNKALIGTIAAAAILMTSLPASAQKADRQFRREVRQACKEVAQKVMDNPRMRVDAVGSESYAMALVRGTGLESQERERAICVFNKETRQAELGTFFPKPKKNNKKKNKAEADQAMPSNAMDDMDTMDDDEETTQN